MEATLAESEVGPFSERSQRARGQVVDAGLEKIIEDLNPLLKSRDLAGEIFPWNILEKEQAMELAAEKELEHLGESHGCADHDHDLIHELSRRLDSLWRYDQYIHNADFRQQLVDFWINIKAQEEENIRHLKALIKQEIQNECF